MQSVTNEVYERALANKDNVNILCKILNSGLGHTHTPEEIQSISMEVLLKALKKYNPSRNTKFTSYLYQTAKFSLIHLRNSPKKPLCGESQTSADLYYKECERQYLTENAAYDILESIREINEYYYQVLVYKFYDQMTYKEIGEKIGKTKECARQTVKRALKKCRELECV